MRELSILSLEPLRYEVAGTHAGVRIDPTLLPLPTFALTAPGVDPASFPGTGVWESVGAGNSVRYFAVVSCGPGGALTAGAKGDTDVWVKISDSPYAIARKIDTIRIV